jgi:hypothetical protein
MRSGTAPGPGPARAGGRWSRYASPAAAAALGGLALVLTAALGVTTAAAHQASFGDLGIPVAVGLSFAAVGVVVARRQPANPIGWLLTATAIVVLVTSLTSEYGLLRYRLGYGGLPAGPAAVVVEAVSGPLPYLCLPVAVLLFPDGRLPSRRWRRALEAFVLIAALYAASELGQALGAVVGHTVRVDSGGALLALDHPPKVLWESAAHWLGLGTYPLVWLMVASRQVTSWRRAWREAGDERRQQLKWLMSGACVAGLGLIGFAVVDALAGSTTSAAVQVVDDALGLLLVMLPVAIGVGILKYHLYDIDRIISRTLAYAIVTGLLVGVYAGLVLLATGVFRFHTPVAVAAATLAAAALFNPVRRRVQRLVDRRFNRARYDADKTVTAFAGRLQDAVDLDSIRDDLTGVVHQALEPAHLSVWVSRLDLGLGRLRHPRVDDLDAGAIEVRQVASGQCRPAGPANGGDESVETGERLPSPLAGTGDDRVLLSGGGIDRQDLLIKGAEGVVRGI